MSQAVSVALTTLLGRGPGQLETYFAFHRRAGVDVVVVDDVPVPARAGEVLEQLVREGFVKRVPATSQTELARVAADELGVEWVIPGTLDEIWWPRGESIRDVLALIPRRYGVVQALIRTFVDDHSPPGAEFESRTVRTSLLGPSGSDGVEPERLLRPIYRATQAMIVDDQDWTLGGRRVPLRAWYPVEVFRFPRRVPTLTEDQLAAALANGSFVVDTRVRDVLAVHDASVFTVPTIVDDASYAVECAAVGEVDLVRIDVQIRALELRIAELEARFWPTLRRSLKRLARRPG